MRKGLIRRARDALRGQDFESESGDRDFENVFKITYWPERHTAYLSSEDAISVDILEGVYKVETGDSVFLESASAEKFDYPGAKEMSIEFVVHPSCGVVNAVFDEARGTVELYLAE